MGYVVDGAPGTYPVIAFPQAVRNRFQKSETFLTKWDDFANENVERFGTPPQPQAGSTLQEDVVVSCADLDTAPPTKDPALLNVPTSDDLVDMQELMPLIVAKAPLPPNRKNDVIVTRGGDGALKTWLSGDSLAKNVVLP